LKGIAYLLFYALVLHCCMGFGPALGGRGVNLILWEDRSSVCPILWVLLHGMLWALVVSMP